MCRLLLLYSGDFSTASLLLSAGTLVGGEITVSNLDFSLPQGDSKILEILKKIGAVISIDKRNGTVKLRESKN